MLLIVRRIGKGVNICGQTSRSGGIYSGDMVVNSYLKPELSERIAKGFE